MIFFPPAKINIGLNVLGKRDDGYHEIETCMYPIPLCDVLEIVPADSFSFTSGGLRIEGAEESNLCVKAYRLMESRYSIAPVHIHLIKQIPMGAGLGGGSSDGAYVLKGLNELFELNLNPVVLKSLSAELGSDCPFFIGSTAQIARGRGELLEDVEIDLTGYFLKVVNPQIHISTAVAYSNVSYNEQQGFSELLKGGIDTWKNTIHNAFENSIFPDNPEIEKIKDDLYAEGAIYSSMSGSGSTVYGLFKNRPDEESTYYCKVLSL